MGQVSSFLEVKYGAARARVRMAGRGAWGSRLSGVRVLLVCAWPASCLYEDQAGKVDWSRANVGRAAFALFPSAQREAVVASADGVVAGLDIQTGVTSWRRVLPDGEAVGRMISVGDDLLVTLGTARTASGTVGSVRMWSVGGALLWDAMLPEVGAGRSPAVAVGEGAIFVGSGTTVVAFHAATGEELWRWHAPTDKGGNAVIVQLAAKRTEAGGIASLHTYVIQERAGSTSRVLLTASLAPTDGKQLDKHELRHGDALAPTAEVHRPLFRPPPPMTVSKPCALADSVSRLAGPVRPDLRRYKGHDALCPVPHHDLGSHPRLEQAGGRLVVHRVAF